MQAIVNAAPTTREGDRVAATISAPVGAGIDGSYLANLALRKCGGRPATACYPHRRLPWPGSRQRGSPPAVPSDDDISKLGQALAIGRHGDRDGLMACTAVSSGLRWGGLATLTIRPGRPCPSASSRSTATLAAVTAAADGQDPAVGAERH
jgi:hypothetical protein